MSEPTFAKLVDESKMPKLKKIRGMAIWDRQALDAAFDALSEDEPARRNTIDEDPTINVTTGNKPINRSSSAYARGGPLLQKIGSQRYPHAQQ